MLCSGHTLLVSGGSLSKSEFVLDGVLVLLMQLASVRVKSRGIPPANISTVVRVLVNEKISSSSDLWEKRTQPGLCAYWNSD